MARDEIQTALLQACYQEVMSDALDPVLARFRGALADLYGDRLERVVLFGSRARGDARDDSDYDVAVFLRNPESFGREAERIAAIEMEILYDTGAVINALPFADGELGATTRFMSEVRREGLLL